MVLEKIKDILAAQLDVNVADITETTDIADDLGADSLDAVEIIMELEDEFNIQIPDEDAASLETVASVVLWRKRNLVCLNNFFSL